MTDRSKASDPQATQSELTSEELGDVSGGMMANEPADLSDDGGSGGGTTTTSSTSTRSTTSPSTMENLVKMTASRADVLNQIARLG